MTELFNGVTKLKNKTTSLSNDIKGLINMNPKNFIFYFSLFLIGLILVIVAEIRVFNIASSSIVFQHTKMATVFELLIALWFISWLLESFLEILQKIFQIDEQKELNKPSPKIAKFTAIIGFIVGLLIAWSGVNTVGIFFQPGEQALPIEKVLFGSIDVILTASAIAGGSKGIHQLTMAYREIMQFIRQETTNRSLERTRKDSSS